jgi:endonuclease/exonuclease/phosphatase family metal-dependent hydrolase
MKQIYIYILLFISFSFNAFAQVGSLNEDFSTCNNSMPNGWLKYSVTGVESWQCTTYGYAGAAAQMSGFNGGNHLNEDWLISPQLNLASYTTPLLSFWCRTRYSGAFIQLLVSTNYAGSGNPNSATWTTVPVTLPTTNSDVWFFTGQIDLTAYKNQPFYIAYKYISSTSAAATWRLDDIHVAEGTLSLSKKFVNAGECAAGWSSAANSFSFTMTTIANTLDIVVPLPFEVSKDGTNFSNTITYTSSASGIAQNVYVRISPSVSNKVYRDKLYFINNGNTINNAIQILGTSLPDDKTLRVMNWNMRWFGSPSFCNCDTSIARINATQLMKDVDADLYCLQEVVSVSQLASICANMGPNYAYLASPFCSGATSPANQSYNDGQKLAYIYNTNKIENLGAFGLLSSTYPADTSAYYCWSSGRFPYMFKAKLKLASGNSDTVYFANIHAKASNTTSDYNRRVCAVEHLTDSLNGLFPSKKIVVLGDFNDYLDGTSVVGQSVSPYQYLLSNGFTGLTLPSLFAGQSTFVGSVDHMIDNVVYSNTMQPFTVDSSTFVFTESQNYITNYVNTTSDHFPLMSYFKFNFPNQIDAIYFEAQHVNRCIIVNPTQGNLHIFPNSNEHAGVWTITLTDLAGKILYSKPIILGNHGYSEEFSYIQSGMYLVHLQQDKHTETHKWLIQN